MCSEFIIFYFLSVFVIRDKKLIIIQKKLSDVMSVEVSEL